MSVCVRNITTDPHLWSISKQFSRALHANDFLLPTICIYIKLYSSARARIQFGTQLPTSNIKPAMFNLQSWCVDHSQTLTSTTVDITHFTPGFHTFVWFSCQINAGICTETDLCIWAE